MVVDQTLGVALVDDDPMVLDIVGAILSAKTKFVVFKESDGDGLLALLARERVDCIVLDYTLGGENGFAVMQRAKEQFATVPPVVMLTGNGAEATVVKAMRLGIDDYVIKRTMNPGELIAAIVRAVENDRKEAAIKGEFERLKAATAIDLITGMLARAKLEESLAALAALDAAARAHYALILAQLANMKEIQEKFGLKTGELALREFATRLRQGIRSDDICGRFGENALLVIANVNGDRIVSTRLCERLAARAAARFDTDAGSVPLSGRFGAAICVPEVGDAAAKPEDLIELAREAVRIATEAEHSWALLPLAPAVHGGAPVSVEGDGALAPIRPRPAAEMLRTGDRRREPRQRVFKRGQIVVPERNISMNCMVRNLSTHGAGLRIEAVFAVPECFELAIFAISERRKVRVRWQAGVDLGVEFVDIA